MENNCYMTLMTNENYLPCIIRNAQRMRYLNVKYPYIVLIPKNNFFLKQALEKENILYEQITIEKINQNSDLFYNDTINKFMITKFYQYDKICFLDGDLILIDNPDNEFNFLSDNQDLLLYQEIRENNKVEFMGQFFICRPSFTNIDIIKKMVSNDSTIIDDEMIFLKLINTNQCKYKIMSNHPETSFLHFSGCLKPWQYYKKLMHPYFYNLFYILDEKEFNKELKLYDNEIMSLWNLYQKNNVYEHQGCHISFCFNINDKLINKIKTNILLISQLELQSPYILLLTTADIEMIIWCKKNNILYKIIENNEFDSFFTALSQENYYINYIPLSSLLNFNNFYKNKLLKIDKESLLDSKGKFIILE